MDDIRYFRYRGSFNYYVLSDERVIHVNERGYIHITKYDAQDLLTNYYLGLGLIELKGDKIPDPGPIEERYILGMDNEFLMYDFNK